MKYLFVLLVLALLVGVCVKVSAPTLVLTGGRQIEKGAGDTDKALDTMCDVQR